ncbi:MAG: hypothetical protein R3B72_48885 [Polyangiaceae bacterium]
MHRILTSIAVGLLATSTLACSSLSQPHEYDVDKDSVLAARPQAPAAAPAAPAAAAPAVDAAGNVQAVDPQRQKAVDAIRAMMGNGGPGAAAGAGCRN